MPQYLKALSKIDCTVTEPLTLEQLQVSALMRIADSTEKMASNYQKMEDDLATYKLLLNKSQQNISSLNRSISNLKGQITKLKNKN